MSDDAKPYEYAERMFAAPVELRGGELRFDGYHRPEWPSNRR